MSLLALLRKQNRKTLFTTPSHGQKFFIFNKLRNFYKYDISETDAHNPQKALSDAEKRASKIYGTKYTHFLTNGSTSGIIASVLTCTNRGDKVLIWRNAHPSHLNAVKLAGCEPVFYDLPTIKEWGVPATLTPHLINFHTSMVIASECEAIQLMDYHVANAPRNDKNLKNMAIKAIIITSPTYEGIVSDIKSIKEAFPNTYLIVDEAHGALYQFSEKLPQSAVNIADFTIQSLHKTAGGLNPTALLHVNCDLDASKALSMINTTSPSYPLLASIEANINYLNSQNGRKKIDELIENIKYLRSQCPNIQFGGDDITKILIKKDGLTGYELSEKLFEEFDIEDEKTNEISTMLLCGLGTSDKKLKRLGHALKHISN